MPLAPHTRLGPYEVLAPVGAGGMGEVYRARDTRLDRDVALKILPSAVAQDPERLSRFEREAKVVASLNHPNIAQIYGVEHDGDTRAIVMELVAGSTLTVPQPLETALDYARQIAEALEAAHEKGITHRDLKPANIMVTPGGVVKVLDFGLATAPTREQHQDPTNSPTFTMAATQAGIIMGTAGYMSPEQAAGKAVDRRSDIWSFGVVLWEMLTGARLFDGETVSHTIADVLRAPIDFGRLPPTVPAPIAELVKRCLDRNVRTRLQSIGEARIAVEQQLKNPTSGPAPAQPRAVPRKAAWAAWISAGVLATVAAGLGAIGYRHSQEPPPRLLRASIMPPAKTAISATSVPAISPDGNKLAFSATTDGKTMIWVRDLDSLSARAITGSEAGVNPFWSPDSQTIGFHSEGKLKRIDLASGSSLTLCSTEGNFHGASWSPRGVILFASAPTGPLYRVSATGGEPKPVTALDQAAGEISHRLPFFLPDGRHFLYTIRNHYQGEKSAVYVGDLDSNDRVLVLKGEAHAMYVAEGGFLVYVAGGITEGPAMAQRFDPSTFKTSGEPFPIAESVSLTVGIWASHEFTVARNGTLVYAGGGALGAVQLTWMDRAGKVLGKLGEPGTGIFTGAISRDGSTVATSRLRDIWLYDLTRGVSSRFTFNPAESASTAPFWSGDGKSIYFGQSDKLHPTGLMRKALDGGAVAEAVGTPWGEPPRVVSLISCSPDGRYVVARLNPGGPTSADLWIMRLDTPGEKPRPYLASNANEQSPAISPGSDWLAYASDETRRFEIYVQSFPTPGRRYQVSVNGGTIPAWSRDGKELYFIAPDRRMMAVEIRKNGDKLEIGSAKPLFDSKIVGGNFTAFDVSKDGRFLIPVQEEPWGLPLTLVTNWQTAVPKR